MLPSHPSIDVVSPRRRAGATRRQQRGSSGRGPRRHLHEMPPPLGARAAGVVKQKGQIPVVVTPCGGRAPCCFCRFCFRDVLTKVMRWVDDDTGVDDWGAASGRDGQEEEVALNVFVLCVRIGCGGPPLGREGREEARLFLSSSSSCLHAPPHRITHNHTCCTSRTHHHHHHEHALATRSAKHGSTKHKARRRRDPALGVSVPAPKRAQRSQEEPPSVSTRACLL